MKGKDTNGVGHVHWLSQRISLSYEIHPIVSPLGIKNKFTRMESGLKDGAPVCKPPFSRDMGHEWWLIR
jgi:hypothetical protein